MLSLARWQPKHAQQFPSEIMLWVKVIGVPLEFRTAPTFESIGDAIGRTVAVDVDHARVQVVVDAFKELCVETIVDFTGGEFYDGEEAPVSLRYEKLFGYCKTCYSLCHKEEKCPLGMLSSNKSPEQNRDTRDGIGGNFDGGKHDDRARSYSGVLVNGNMSYQNKERDSRDYYGKGKGKMFEEPESKWVKVAERGNKRSYNRGNYRGASENSHYKQGRREDLRVESQEGRARSSSEQIRAPQELKDTREELPKLLLSPSKEFKEEPAKTQTTGTEVILDSAEEEMGLQKVKDLVENQGALSDEDVMEMDKIRAAFLEHGIDMDNPQDLSEEEPEGEAILQEEGDDIAEEKEDCISVEEKEMVLGEPVKKQGLRKRQFKPTISTAGSNKTRISNALVSPRKRGVAKTWSRYGENSKTLEGKGTSNPTNGLQKH